MGREEGRISVGHEKTLKGKEYEHYLKHGDGFMGGYICQNLYFKHMQFIEYKLYLTTTF